jgi:hypothetical protein
MTGFVQNADPFMLLTELARRAGADRLALELAITAGTLTVISRHGRYWVLRAAADDWLSWRAGNTSAAAPLNEIEL